MGTAKAAKPACGCLALAALVVLVGVVVAGLLPDRREPSLERGAPPNRSRTPSVPEPKRDPTPSVPPDKTSKSPGRPTSSPPRPAPGAVAAVVAGYVDGDTVKLRAAGGNRYLPAGRMTTVRLLEIDTPESVDPNEPVECFARRASSALERTLPLGARIWVKADRELRDQYGRTLLYLWTHKGTFVNLQMVRRGFAKAVLFEPNDEYIARMRAAEQRARSQGVGLWGECRYFGQPAGQPRGFAGPSGGGGSGTDPRFDTCAEANARGYGPYVRGQDPEYRWYDDADGDGVVCET